MFDLVYHWERVFRKNCHLWGIVMLGRPCAVPLRSPFGKDGAGGAGALYRASGGLGAGGIFGAGVAGGSVRAPATPVLMLAACWAKLQIEIQFKHAMTARRPNEVSGQVQAMTAAQMRNRCRQFVRPRKSGQVLGTKRSMRVQPVFKQPQPTRDRGGKPS